MNDLPLYLLRPGFDGLLADRWREFAQDNPDLFVELDVSRLSTDIEQALLDDDLNTDLLDVFQDGMEQGVGGVRSEGFDSISKKYASCVAERIAGLLTQLRRTRQCI